jgi:intracellular multiplication protein IcmK
MMAGRVVTMVAAITLAVCSHAQVSGPQPLGPLSAPANKQQSVAIVPISEQQRGNVQGAGQVPQPMPSPVVEFDLVNEVRDRISPFSADEVRRLRRELEERERAWFESISKRPPPKAVVSEHRLDLSPGATPPIVRVVLGAGALVSFHDVNSKPWPIKEAENFNSVGVRVSQLSSHVLSVSLKTPAAAGGVGVVLDGLASPITFSVVPGQTETDHRIEMLVPRVLGAGDGGGAASGITSMSVPQLNTNDLSAFLQRIPPAGARSLKVEGPAPADFMAWQYTKDRMVVRTALAVVSPAPYRRHSSSDGTSVYELPLSPVISVSGAGRGFTSVVIGGIQVGSIKGGKNE